MRMYVQRSLTLIWQWIGYAKPNSLDIYNTYHQLANAKATCQCIPTKATSNAILVAC
jgi:hypothetical protein